jgi:hypothetical protein
VTRDWFKEFGSGAGRFIRIEKARGAVPGVDSPLIVRAAAFALLLTIALLAALIIIPLVVFAGVIFLASLGYMKVRRFIGNLFAALPRDDGRRNVRVRLPESRDD